MIAYLTILYIFIYISTLLGLLNRTYDSTLLQRLGLAVIGLWCIWRIYMFSYSEYDYPHEPVIATGMAIFSLGSWKKTQMYCTRRRSIARKLGYEVKTPWEYFVMQCKLCYKNPVTYIKNYFKD